MAGLVGDGLAQAKQEHRFVLLDLGAVWCGWCHVMERNTHGNPAVADLIEARDTAVRADQDARPDLSRRYEDHGRPAAVIFSADGREIVKLRRCGSDARMLSMLQHILADQSPTMYRGSCFDHLGAACHGGSSAPSEPVRSALERPAAFFGAGSRCSLPVFTSGGLDAPATRLSQGICSMRARPRNRRRNSERAN